MKEENSESKAEKMSEKIMLRLSPTDFKEPTPNIKAN